MQSSEIVCSGGPLLLEGWYAKAGGSAEYGSNPNKSSEFVIMFWNKEINLIGIFQDKDICKQIPPPSTRES